MPQPDRNWRSPWIRLIEFLSRFQFSLWRLLIVVTIVAIVLGFAVTFRDFVDVVVFALVACVLPTPFVICALFGRGDVQAFAIGALVPWGVLLICLSNLSFITGLLWLVTLPAVCGVIAVVTRRWLRELG